MAAILDLTTFCEVTSEPRGRSFVAAVEAGHAAGHRSRETLNAGYWTRAHADGIPSRMLILPTRHDLTCRGGAAVSSFDNERVLKQRCINQQSKLEREWLRRNLCALELYAAFKFFQDFVVETSFPGRRQLLISLNLKDGSVKLASDRDMTPVLSYSSWWPFFLFVCS